MDLVGDPKNIGVTNGVEHETDPTRGLSEFEREQPSASGFSSWFTARS
jgi:hypothetical protein